MSELVDFRVQKDQFFGRDRHSPLPAGRQEGFPGLGYFAEDSALRFVLELDEFPDQSKVELQTSTGDVATYVRLGRVWFVVDGEGAKLTVYRQPDGDGLFLPFADATSGEDTYASGRYLEVEATADGRLVVDFNYAYNPNCAYDEGWSCPLTPSENRLKVPIRGGEKNFE